MKLKRRLHDIRMEQGISQEALAERVNVSRQTISKWENGVVRPSADNLAALSEVFGLPVDAFLKDDWTPPEEPEPVIVEVPVEVPVPVPNPIRYRLWAILFALVVAVGIAVGVLFFREQPDEESVSELTLQSEVIDPSTWGSGISHLPPED